VGWDWFSQRLAQTRMRQDEIMIDLEERGTGSVSCNSIVVLHLCYFLNQEDLMEREAVVQNP